MDASERRNQEISRKSTDKPSDTEVDDLVEKIDGYQIAEKPRKSTGRVDVVVQKKTVSGGYSVKNNRTVRREKKDRGVMDIDRNPQTVNRS